MGDLLPLARAIELVLERARPLPAVDVPLADAAGRVVAESARAAVDLPPFASSAMDGFAVRAADTPGTLAVVGAIAAGRPASARLREREAMAIATGGVVPEGADAVVQIENVVQTDNSVRVPVTATGTSIRPRGGDARAGDEVVPPGTRLTPAHVGALAAAGVASVRCFRRPRVSILATGTELRRPGESLEPGQIYEANGTMLVAASRGAGAVADVLDAVADDEREHHAALEQALADADVVVSSGGVSVGPHDLVRDVVRSLGVEEVFWRVAVKPGKPISFGARGSTLVFGLPGNPVSTLVGFELFVRPALRALEGELDPGPRFEPARLTRAVRRNAGRDELLRARRTEGGVEPVTGQESHMIVRSASADVLVLVPRGDGELEPGADVRVLRLGSY